MQADEQVLDVEEMRVALGQALFKLPEGQRIIIQLRYFEGFSTARTAALLGVQPGAVKTRLHRSYKCLRRALQKVLFDPDLE